MAERSAPSREVIRESKGTPMNSQIAVSSDLIALRFDARAFYHRMMLAVVDGRAVGAFERGHPRIKRHADEFADRSQCGFGLAHQIVILQLVNRGTAAH